MSIRTAGTTSEPAPLSPARTAVPMGVDPSPADEQFGAVCLLIFMASRA